LCVVRSESAIDRVIERIFDGSNLSCPVFAASRDGEADLAPVPIAGVPVHEAGGDESVDNSAWVGADVADEHVAEFFQSEWAVVGNDPQGFGLCWGELDLGQERHELAVAL
jgi:hypothetical protein